MIVPTEKREIQRERKRERVGEREGGQGAQDRERKCVWKRDGEGSRGRGS